MKLWLSTSPNSEVIVELKFSIPLVGLWNTLLNVTLDEFPPVNELLSPGLVAVILIPPPLKFSIENEFPNESEITAVVPVKELTYKLVLYVPRLLVNEADPILSPIAIDDIVNEPPSETNKALAISVSPASWLTLIVKLDKLSQS